MGRRRLTAFGRHLLAHGVGATTWARRRDRAEGEHVARVCHVHCKDVRPYVIRLARNRNWSFLRSVINGAFTVPGDGAIDFPALLGILHDHGYRGWLVVEAEQDPAVAPSYEYAEKGSGRFAARRPAASPRSRR
jgi:inosose dehydratase